jgi:hypothetical protein
MKLTNPKYLATRARPFDGVHHSDPAHRVAAIISHCHEVGEARWWSLLTSAELARVLDPTYDHAAAILPERLADACAEYLSSSDRIATDVDLDKALRRAFRKAKQEHTKAVAAAPAAERRSA